MKEGRREIKMGDASLCAWSPYDGEIWVQTRDPKHAERMYQRDDAKLISWSVRGGYLRIFKFEGKTIAWAKRLISRYQATSTCAGTVKIAQNPVTVKETDENRDEGTGPIPTETDI